MSTEAIDPRYPIGKMVPAEYSEKEFARRYVFKKRYFCE